MFAMEETDKHICAGKLSKQRYEIAGFTIQARSFGLGTYLLKQLPAARRRFGYSAPRRIVGVAVLRIVQ